VEERVENVVKEGKYEEMKRETAKNFDKCVTKEQRIKFDTFHLISAFHFSLFRSSIALIIRELFAIFIIFLNNELIVKIR